MPLGPPRPQRSQRPERPEGAGSAPDPTPVGAGDPGSTGGDAAGSASGSRWEPPTDADPSAVHRAPLVGGETLDGRTGARPDDATGAFGVGWSGAQGDAGNLHDSAAGPRPPRVGGTRGRALLVGGAVALTLAGGIGGFAVGRLAAGDGRGPVGVQSSSVDGNAGATDGLPGPPPLGEGDRDGDGVGPRGDDDHDFGDGPGDEGGSGSGGSDGTGTGTSDGSRPT